METNIYLFLEYQLIFALLGLGYLMIKNQLGASTKRFTILLLPIIALIIEWFNHQLSFTSEIIPSIVTLDPVTVSPGYEESSEVVFTSFIFLMALLIPPICAILYRFIKLGISLSRVNFSQDQEYRIGNYGTHSYSFFNRIVLELGLTTEETETVLEHEKIHGKLMHSIDVIIYEFYALILWINPFYHLIKTNLKMTHEQEVDEFMYKKHGIQYINLLLNKTFGTSSISYVLTNQFYDASKLKKRISIMKEKSKNKWALLFIIPVLGLSASLVSFRDTDLKEETPIEVKANNDPETASFKGGMSALITYFQKNVKYPKKAEKENIQGKVMVGFTVTKEGTIKDVNVKKTDNEIFNNEAVRVVKGMPKWNPATKDGKAVASKMVLPISFKL